MLASASGEVKSAPALAIINAACVIASVPPDSSGAFQLIEPKISFVSTAVSPV